MMHVNSSLSASQKYDRKRRLKDLSDWKGRVFSFPAYNATVAIMPEFTGSRMMLVSVSIAELRETKFKRKVGEYHALRRMFEDCEYIKLPSVFNASDFWPRIKYMPQHQENWAEQFAASFVL